MFARGNWAILGLAKESLDAFRTSLEDQTLMVASSQMAASAIARHLAADAVGVNPYSAPRLDEEYAIDPERQAELAGYATTDPDARRDYKLPPEILESQGYAYTVDRFRIHASVPWYGLWAVANEWKNVSDLPSIKEQQSYVLLERPYKFLQSIDKKSVDQVTLNATRIVRTQAPVLLDFNEGRVYIENTNKKLIYRIMVMLKQLGAEIFPVGWTYSQPNWTAEILHRLYQQTQYVEDFVKRAEEAKRFSAKEIEKLEDRELEGIVANFFSMTKLPSDLWAGISTPAQIRLDDTSPAIGVKACTSATTLLHMTDEATVLSGALTFQEQISYTSKDGGERTFRKDLFTLDVNDRINLTEVGAAMLRGFNLPNLKKDIQREIKQTQQVPSLEQFWGMWLLELSKAVRTIEASFREILEIDGKEAAGVLSMHVPTAEEPTQLVDA